jgi:kumamolisin
VATKRAKVPVSGSERAPLEGAARVGDADPKQKVSVTLVLRPRSSARRRTPADHPLSSEEVANVRGADPADIEKVRSFAADHGLSVDDVNAAARSVSLSGTVAQVNDAFNVNLGRYTDALGSYRGRTGSVYVPANLGNAVQAVLGLDDRPQARAMFRIKEQPEFASGDGDIAPHAAGDSFSPDELGKLYEFPTDADGSGQTVAIIELGGGYKTADLRTYFKELGIRKPSVSAVSVDGAKNTPVGDPNSADGEVMLDIEVVGAAAPRAKIAVYFAPNTTKGFYDGIAAALHDTKRSPSAISISWGGPESAWTGQAMDVYDQLFQDAADMGVTITAASGDDGSSDRVQDGRAHVDFPASSPYVLACGGTRVTANGDSIATETVWNNGAGQGATGGGVSDHFDPPSYQQGAGVPPSANPGKRKGRGVPDVAGDADPQTGYRIRVDGHDLVFGGTSAVAPLWAALVALANQKLGARVGFLQPQLYGSHPKSAFNDVTAGNNGAYKSKKGWDACTGWGSPRGDGLIDALSSS